MMEGVLIGLQLGRLQDYLPSKPLPIILFTMIPM
jgi:F0F1-type ATP synthase assembly protein I